MSNDVDTLENHYKEGILQVEGVVSRAKDRSEKSVTLTTVYEALQTRVHQELRNRGYNIFLCPFHRGHVVTWR
jgi:Fe2+ or Zn2+ uptake regulation protein